MRYHPKHGWSCPTPITKSADGKTVLEWCKFQPEGPQPAPTPAAAPGPYNFAKPVQQWAKTNGLPQEDPKQDSIEHQVAAYVVGRWVDHGVIKPEEFVRWFNPVLLLIQDEKPIPEIQIDGDYPTEMPEWLDESGHAKRP